MMKRLKTYLIILALVAGLLAHSPAGAGELAIYTEENPPMNFTKDDRLIGSSTEIVREILRRLNQPDTIKVLPWARGYTLLKSRPNVVLFSTARTEERDSLFQWVGPLFSLRTGFYALKKRRLRFDSIEDIKSVGAIATYKDDVREQILKNRGFTNLDSSKSPSSNIKKLFAGRVDLWFYDNIGMPSLAHQAGIDPAELELVYTFKEFEGYIAMSKGTPPAIVDQWQRTLDQMKQDGTFAKLSLKWLPKESISAVVENGASTSQEAPVQLAIYTENNPPGNYLANGKPEGFVVRLVREILHRLDQPDTIEVVPWARGYNLALSQPNVALFSTTRLPQREKLFQWVGPVYTQRWGFYAKKDSGIRINSLADARGMNRIGTYRNDAKEQFLTEKGFDNLISSNKNISNVKHLIDGRIDIWVSSDVNMTYIVRQAGFEPDQLERVFDFRTVENYIAFSAETPVHIVSAWQQIFDEIKQDGTYAEIKANFKPL